MGMNSATLVNFVQFLTGFFYSFLENWSWSFNTYEN